MQIMFGSLSDGRSYEGCEGARKTALTWGCEISYNQNRVRVVGSQLFRVNRLLLPYLYCLYNNLAISYQRDACQC